MLLESQQDKMVIRYKKEKRQNIGIKIKVYQQHTQYNKIGHKKLISQRRNKNREFQIK